MRQQLIQLLIALIVVLPPVLNWLYQTLKKQKQRRDAETTRQRREVEQLRTGRPVEDAAIPVEQVRQQQEVNQRREAELAELRRRIGAGEQPARDAILIQIPGTSGPIVVQRPARTPDEPSRPPPRRPGRSKRGSRASRAVEAPAPSMQRRIEASDVEATQRLVTEGVSPPAAPGPIGESPTLGAGWTTADWRRAIVIREVLGTPLALRGPEDRAG